MFSIISNGKFCFFILYNINMAKDNSGPGILVILSPFIIVLLLLLYPLWKMVVKNNSSDVEIDNKAFSVDAGVEKKNLSGYQPSLNNGGYNVSYTAGSNETEREEIGWGAKEGYLLAVLEQNSSDISLLKELYNNKHMIRGFMARENVQEYLLSAENIKRLLSNKEEVNKFLAEPGMKALLASPQAMQTILDSAFANALVSEPAAQEFMKDSAAIENILTENRNLVRVIKKPAIKNFIVKNAKTANLARAVGWK